MKIHTITQGSVAWHEFRLDHGGASEAAAMLGLSPYTSRTELLHQKHTGTSKEVSPALQVVFDRGHQTEAMARPLVEEMIGSELYPVTCSDGYLSASCDGLTMDGSLAMEHKQFNAALFASIKEGTLPEEHWPQAQQVLLVTGADKLIFVCSNGTKDQMASMEVFPDAIWFDRLRDGWAQFQKDLENFTPVEVIPSAVATPTMSLPALSIQVNGSISLIDNLAVFGAKLNEFVENLDMKPSTDQAFADAEAAVKTLQKAQDALEAAKSSALAQTASIDDMVRTVALYVDVAKKARLALANVVKNRKDQIRTEIATQAKAAYLDHVAMLNKRLGHNYVVLPLPDFSAPMKGLKKIDTLQNAVDTLMAQAKIEANAQADKIEINLNSLRELAANHKFLFNDTAQIIMKANDDLVMLIKSRISEHEAAELKKAELQRERIAAEERAKLEAEARAKEEISIEVKAAMPVEPPQAAPVMVKQPVSKHESQLSGDARLRDQIDYALAGMMPDELNQVLDVITAILSKRVKAA